MQGAKNLKSRGGSRTALTGVPQRFPPLDIFSEGGSSSNIRGVIPESQEPDSYLTGQGCSATPQMDFLRSHQRFKRKEIPMPKILMIHGSNMNLLGIRQPEIYGTTSAAELDKMLVEYAQKKKFDLEIFSTNSEGECIDRIIKAHFDKVDVLVMNPGGFTYAAHSIRDTIKGVKIPYVEIHLSNHYERGLHSVVAPAAQGVIMGLGIQVYFAGLDAALYIAAQKKK
jgi:3-dehydroquinate dehydratase-2